MKDKIKKLVVDHEKLKNYEDLGDSSFFSISNILKNDKNKKFIKSLLLNWEIRVINYHFCELHYQAAIGVSPLEIQNKINDFLFKNCKNNECSIFLYKNRLFIQNFRQFNSTENKIVKIYQFFKNEKSIKNVLFLIKDNSLFVSFEKSKTLSIFSDLNKKLHKFINNTYFEEFELVESNGFFKFNILVEEDIKEKRETYTSIDIEAAVPF